MFEGNTWVSRESTLESSREPTKLKPHIASRLEMNLGHTCSDEGQLLAVTVAKFCYNREWKKLVQTSFTSFNPSFYVNNLLCFTVSCLIISLKKNLIKWLVHLGLNLKIIISFYQILTNVLPVHHRAIKAVQTLLVVTLVPAYLVLSWTVIEKLAMVRET